jgi:chaperonin GroEL (HSP60 family)
MATSDDTSILEDTERSSGRAALRKNVQAAMALAGAVRSTLGPKGLDKLLLDSEGKIQVTNDGVTVLEAAKVQHPTARMLISSSSTQDRVARDGTTSTVLITAEMLQNAWDLVNQGVHPTVIAAGYRLAENQSQIILEEISRNLKSEKEILQATQTCLAGKGESSLQGTLSVLAVEAAAAIAEQGEDGIKADPTRIKILANKGGQSSDTHLVNGIVIAKRPAHPEMEERLEGGRILVIDGALERQQMVMDAKLKITSPGMLQAFRNKEQELLTEQVEDVVSLGVNILAVKDGIDDYARSMLEAKGITAYRRVERKDLEQICITTGATMVHSANTASAKDIGSFHSSRQELWSDTSHWILEGSTNKGQTLITRGSSEEMLDEVERCFADALGVACQLHEEARLLPGGGATQVALARRLRRYAETIPGREQLAVEAFADALEVIPRALAENAGLDSLGNLLELTAAQSNSENDWLGLDLRNGTISDMDEVGIREPLRISRQAIKGATDSAVAVLRIDDILWAKQDAQVPDEVQQQLDEQYG